jgi:hypothetical protein
VTECTSRPPPVAEAVVVVAIWGSPEPHWEKD